MEQIKPILPKIVYVIFDADKPFVQKMYPKYIELVNSTKDTYSTSTRFAIERVFATEKEAKAGLKQRLEKQAQELLDKASKI